MFDIFELLQSDAGIAVSQGYGIFVEVGSRSFNACIPRLQVFANENSINLSVSLCLNASGIFKLTE